jgi:hypothetical protein
VAIEGGTSADKAAGEVIVDQRHPAIDHVYVPKREGECGENQKEEQERAKAHRGCGRCRGRDFSQDGHSSR